MKPCNLVSAIFCGAITSSLSAAIVSYTDLGLWSDDVVAAGAGVATETFNNYHGFYPSSVTGSAVQACSPLAEIFLPPIGITKPLPPKLK